MIKSLNMKLIHHVNPTEHCICAVYNIIIYYIYHVEAVNTIFKSFERKKLNRYIVKLIIL